MVNSPPVSVAAPLYTTPHLTIRLPKVAANYRALCAALPQARHHYAIKANPHPDILQQLQRLGSAFECASIQEIEMCLQAGVAPGDILYGNPLKKASEIDTAYRQGIRQFVFDAQLELEKIAVHAPGAEVICRIKTNGEGAISPLSIKFGCSPEKAIIWLQYAKELGLVPVGVSFHVGSQQLDPSAWRVPIHQAAMIFDRLADVGIETLRVMNVGGGFPVSYREPVPPIEEYGRAIASYATEAFAGDTPLIYTEPGRYMVGDAGSIEAEVVLVTPCEERAGWRWVYLDIGRYGGLVEEDIDYPVLSDCEGETGPVILAGQTCDSNDVIYQECFGYQLPLELRPGDRVVLAHTGAYTTTYSTTLNGFPVLSSHCAEE